MPEESREVDPQADKEALNDLINEATKNAEDDGDSDDDQHVDPSTSDAGAAQAAAMKKRSKRKKLKSALTEQKDGEGNLSQEQLEKALDVNPSLKAEVVAMEQAKVDDMLRKLNMSDLITGLVGLWNDYVELVVDCMG